MRTATKWAIAGGGVALVGLLAGLGWYEHSKHAPPLTYTGGNVVSRGGVPIKVGPGGVRFNPDGGSALSIGLGDGDKMRTLSAKVGDIVNVTLPTGAFVLSASYGTGAAWGTGAGYQSRVVSVQLNGPTTISITWNDPNVPANYTTKVAVTT